MAVQALQGTGGVGRTQLASEYVRRHLADYDLVAWIDAERPELIPDQLAPLAPRLADRERVLGPDHPDTLSSRRNLATAYSDAQQYDRAVPQLESVVTQMTQLLGTDHPDTLTACANLAGAYLGAEQFEQAAALYSDVVEQMTRVLGADHPDTLSSRGNLAHAYLNDGQLDRAEDLFESLIADTTRVLGPDHPDTLASRFSRAHAILAAGDVDRAVALLELTRVDCQRVLGPDHPITEAVEGLLAEAADDGAEAVDQSGHEAERPPVDDGPGDWATRYFQLGQRRWPSSRWYSTGLAASGPRAGVEGPPSAITV